jgi:hypothetical protein
VLGEANDLKSIRKKTLLDRGSFLDGIAAMFLAFFDSTEPLQ